MRIDRLMSIIIILLDKKRITAHELADKFEVSLRTIYRDLDSIDLAGIPIRSTAGVGGGFEIMPKYQLDKSVFSTADLSAILLGLSSASAMIQKETLTNVLTKMNSFVPEDKANDIAFSANQIHIDMSSWIGNRNINHSLESIKQALQNRTVLKFNYLDRYENTTSRTAEPYQLVLKGSNWYFQGYCLMRKDFRLFRLSRMTDLLLSKDTFTPRKFQSPELDFSSRLESLQTLIKIRIGKKIMESVLNYCSFEQFSPDGEDHYIVDFPFIENDYYFNILLGFGQECECLEPAHIRKEMKHRIAALSSVYNAL